MNKCIYCGREIDHHEKGKKYCSKCETEYKEKDHGTACNCTICRITRSDY